MALRPTKEERERARLYESLHTGNAGDEDFYRARCRGAKSVLELGAGYGRIVEALAREGSAVMGLEQHPGLLERARARVEGLSPEIAARVALVPGDMRRFSLGRRFERVIIPYNGLLCLLSAEAVFDCFLSAREHLTGEGRLLFDVYRIEEEEAAAAIGVRRDARRRAGDERAPIESEERPLVVIEEAGASVAVFERDRWWPEAQRVDAFYRFESIVEGQARSLVDCIPQRYLFADEIEELLLAAGFALDRLEGGFEGEALDEDAQQIVVEARPR